MKYFVLPPRIDCRNGGCTIPELRESRGVPTISIEANYQPNVIITISTTIIAAYNFIESTATLHKCSHDLDLKII